MLVRPSIVIGDAQTGRASAFQGLHRVAEAIVRGLVPVVPFDPEWRLDIVPRDVVATLVEQRRVGGEVWLTSGERALTLRESLEVLAAVTADHDRPLAPPRFVSPELFDRLIAPVFLDALPPQTARTLVRMLDVFGAYLSHRAPLPSSFAELATRGWHLPRHIHHPAAYLATLLRPLDPADRPGALEEWRADHERAQRGYQRQLIYGPPCPHGQPAGHLPSPLRGHLACPACRTQATDPRQRTTPPASVTEH